MNVVLSEPEPLPARSDQRRRRIRTTFTSGELDELAITEHNTAPRVLYDSMTHVVMMVSE